MARQLAPVFFLGIAYLSAQTLTTGTFLGIVTDPSGGGVPQATVRVFNEATQFHRETVTNSEGNYEFLAMPVGDYHFEFEKSGFRKLLRTGISLSAGHSLRVDGQLTLGNLSETVQVDAKVAQVDPYTANVGETVYGSQVRELLLPTRTFTTLVSLEPGISSNEVQQPTVDSGLSFSMNGSGANNWMLDGGPNQDPYGGGATTMVSLESIAEVRIERSAYSVQYGRWGGGQVNVILRSGTNTFHGTLFEFFRNDKLAARNFFSTAKPELRYNNFGGVVGGPIKHDKVFFFLSNEYRLIRSGSTQTSIVPTPAQIGGDFTGGRTIKDPLTGIPFPNQIIPASRLDPNAQVLLKNWYAPPTPGFLQGALNFSSSEASSTKYRSALGRLDYNIAPGLNFFGHYNIDATPQEIQYAGSPMPNIGLESFPAIYYTAGASLQWSIRPNVLNELTTSYYHGSMSLHTDPFGSRTRVPGFNVPRYFNDVTDVSGYIPSISMGQGYAGISIIAQNISHDAFNLGDSVSYIKGNHTIQFGGNFDRETKTQDNGGGNNNGTFTFDGSASGDALADLLLGNAYQYTEGSAHLTGTCVFKDFAFYLQDRYRVHSRLTLTYGLRWEYFQPEQDYNGTMSFFDPHKFNFGAAATVLPNGQIVPGTQNFGNGIVVVGKNAEYGYGLTNSIYKTFQPRVGFSYALTKDNQTVLRGGYGIFDGRTAIYASAARNNYPFNQGVQLYNTNFSNPAQGALRIFPTSLSNFNSPWEAPNYQRWSLGLQRQLSGFVLEADYVGSRGTHLAKTVDDNQPLPSVAAASGLTSPNAVRPYLGFTSISTYETTGQSMYHSLQVSLVRKFAGGFSYQGAYTYSKSMDDTLTPPNAYSANSLDWGLSSGDRTHVLISSYVWDLPIARKAVGWRRKLFRDWQVAGITSFQSGNPLTVTISPDRAGVGDGGQFPMLEGPVRRMETISQWFNTNVFALPALGTFGNAGRGLVRGPGINNWDMCFSKRTALRENVTLQFRGEFFNLFNHPQYSAVSTTFGSGSFGQVTSARDPRITQLGLRLEF